MLQAAAELPEIVPSSTPSPRQGTKNRQLVPRFSGIVHLSFPRTEVEADLLKDNVLLVGRVYSKQKKALPLRRVLVAEADEPKRLFQLPSLFPRPDLSIRRPPPGASPVPIGEYSQTFYTFVPLAVVSKGGQLAAEFQRLEKGKVSPKVPLLSFPTAEWDSLPPWLKGRALKPLQVGAIPDAGALIQLLGDSHCMSFPTQGGAQTPPASASADRSGLQKPAR
jgi:hypothetical protein